MKFFALLAAAVSATTIKQLQSEAGVVVNGKYYNAADCAPLPHTQAQLDIELDFFSRKLDSAHYDNALKIFNELKKEGKSPRVAIHTWELYDKAFSFPRVRRFDLVQHHMDLIQHFEDNLNQNFTNGQNLTNFIEVAKAAQKALNDKYHDGEFADPASFDPTADHPTTWSNVKL